MSKINVKLIKIIHVETRLNKKTLNAIIILIIVGIVYYWQTSERPSSNTSIETTQYDAHEKIAVYYNNQVSGKMITLNANVSKMLSDDTYEPRHQRFIIELNNSLTVLISHNIDLAPRVLGLNVGDEVTITGQYEWNEKGGVIHWTHHDPQGRRKGGQINHNGKVYR